MLTLLAALLLAMGILLGVEVLTADSWSNLWLLLLTPLLYVVLRLASLLIALWGTRLLERADSYAEQGRLRRALWMLRAAGLASHAATIAMNDTRMRARFLRRAAQHYERWGRWEDVLRVSGKLARLAGGDEMRTLAYNTMLKAMAVLGRREAFAFTFAALEGLFAQGRLGEDESKSPRSKGGEPEAGDDRYRPLAHANYLRAWLAFRDGDFVDALHWSARSRQLDPDYLEPYLLEVEIAGWRDDWVGGGEKIRAAEKALKRAEPKWREQAEMLMRLLGGAAVESGGDGAADADKAAENDRYRAALARAVGNEQWRLGWARIKLAALTRRPAEVEAVIASEREHADANQVGRVQRGLAQMLAAALRHEGNAMEAPYAGLLHEMRRQPVSALVWAEVPWWRALSLIYRGQFTAAIEKLDEFAGYPAWARPPLMQIASDALRAQCYDRLGRPSEGEPAREAAKSRAPEGSKIAWVALEKRDRLTAILPAD